MKKTIKVSKQLSKKVNKKKKNNQKKIKSIKNNIKWHFYRMKHLAKRGCTIYRFNVPYQFSLLSNTAIEISKWLELEYGLVLSNAECHYLYTTVEIRLPLIF